MFDFRYHAISLVGVFLALVIGVLLGLAIGDRGLASSADRSLRDGLRHEVQTARAQADSSAARADRSTRFGQAVLPSALGGRLTGRRVLVVSLDGPDRDAIDAAEKAVEMAGGEVTSQLRLRASLDLPLLADALADTRWAQLAEQPDQLEDVAGRLAAESVTGGLLIDRPQVRSSFAALTSGDLGAADAVIVVRGPEVTDVSDRDADDPVRLGVQRAQSFADAFVNALADLAQPAAGVEVAAADPSLTGWYRDRGLESVDDVDEPAGAASLVVVLADGATGAFGFKDGADALFPEAIGEAPTGAAKP